MPITITLRPAIFDHKGTHKVLILVPLIAAKVSGQFSQLRGWHALDFIPCASETINRMG